MIKRTMPSQGNGQAVTKAAAVDLEVIVTGEVPTPYVYIYREPRKGVPARIVSILRGKGGLINTPMLAFIVRHPRAGTFLIDTGIHPDALRGVRRDYGTFLGGMFRQMKPAADFASQLRERGLDPAAIDLVLMTHLHVDHTGAMRLLPHAEFVCSRSEWTAAHGRRAVFHGYVAHHLPTEEQVRLLDFDEQSAPYESFSRSLDFFGDGSVRILFTPGHTLGHCSILLNVAGQGPVLLVGDAAYTRRNIDQQLLPALTASDRLTANSLRELKSYADRHPEAVIVPSHDPAAWRDLSSDPA